MLGEWADAAAGSGAFDRDAYLTWVKRELSVTLVRFLCVCAFDGFLLWVRIAYACLTTASLRNTHLCYFSAGQCSALQEVCGCAYSWYWAALCGGHGRACVRMNVCA